MVSPGDLYNMIRGLITGIFQECGTNNEKPITNDMHL